MLDSFWSRCVIVAAAALALSAPSAAAPRDLLATKAIAGKSVSLSIDGGNKLRFDAAGSALPQPYRSFTLRGTVPRGQQVKVFGWITCDGYRVKGFTPRFRGSFRHVAKIPGAYLRAGYCRLYAGVSRFGHLLSTGSAKGKIVVRLYGNRKS